MAKTLDARQRTRIRAIVQDAARAIEAGEKIDIAKVASSHPELSPYLESELKSAERVYAARLAAQQYPLESSPTVTAARSDKTADSHMPAIDGYQFIRRIGRGGQSIVYQAIQESTNRKVAVKVLRDSAFANQGELARFEREAQILGQLRHPNIVTVYDRGRASEHFYFVMDYIPGGSLDAYLSDADLSFLDTLRLFAKICHAINAAHLRGIIHRDLKPSNIRIDNDGAPHVLDFGLAKTTVSDSDAVVAVTMTGHFIGSLQWASPEQAEGTPSKIDMRTDVYSLGVILYQMLTSKFPYDVTGHIYEVLDRIMHAKPERPSSVGWRGESRSRVIDDEIETIALKCLSKERSRRYQTAGQLADDIERYLAGDPIEAKRDSVGYLLRKQLKHYRTPLAFATVLIALIMLGGGASFAFWREAESARMFAENEAQWAQRVAAVQANPIPIPDMVSNFALEWDERIHELIAHRGSDDSIVKREKSLKAVWMWTRWWKGRWAGMGDSSQTLSELGPIMESAYATGMKFLREDDPLRLALLQGQIQWLKTDRGKHIDDVELAHRKYLSADAWAELAKLYEELLEAISAADGSNAGTALVMAAESSKAWRNAERDAEAIDALHRYIAIRQSVPAISATMYGVQFDLCKQISADLAARDELIAAFLWECHVDALEHQLGRYFTEDQVLDLLQQNGKVHVNEDFSDAELVVLYEIATKAGRSEIVEYALEHLCSRLTSANSTSRPMVLFFESERISAMLQFRAAEKTRIAIDEFRNRIEHVFGSLHDWSIYARLFEARIGEGLDHGTGSTALMSKLTELLSDARARDRAYAHVIPDILKELSQLCEDVGDVEGAANWREQEAAYQQGLRSGPQNLGFENGDIDSSPDNWWRSVHAPAFWVSNRDPAEGSKCACRKGVAGDARFHWTKYGSIGQTFDARPYRGKKLRLSAIVRINTASDYDGAELFLHERRYDRRRPELYVGMTDQPIRSPEWQRYQVAGLVHEDAEWISIGLVVRGEGLACIDDVRVEIIETDD